MTSVDDPFRLLATSYLGIPYRLGPVELVLYVDEVLLSRCGLYGDLP
jgi:hypothetical protein